MNVNLHLTGELEAFVNELIKKGLAANKTEAIRLAITRYYEDLKTKKMMDEFNQATIDTQWNNSSDEKSAVFYTKRYLNAGKA